MAAAAGYVAGHVLYPEMEIGAAYDKAMQAYIFGPLGMTQTTMSISQAMKGNYASPHGIDMNGKIEKIEQTDDRGFNHLVYAYRPAGAAWASPHEMMKYIQNELTQGVGPDGTRLFAAGPLIERRKPGVSSSKDRFYGMGLATRKIAGIDIVEHGGSMAGYLSQMVIIPGANIGAVILTNSDEGGALLSPFGRRLVEILYDGKGEATAQVAVQAEIRQLNLAKSRQEVTIPGNPATLAGLASHYVSNELGPVDIRKESGQVVFDPGTWSGALATRTNVDGSVSLVLTTGAMRGATLEVGRVDGKRTLTLIDAQRKYLFTDADER